jgi:hypothetical protein
MSFNVSTLSLCCGEYWTGDRCRKCGNKLRGTGIICAKGALDDAGQGGAAKTQGRAVSGDFPAVPGVTPAKRLGKCRKSSDKDRPFLESTFKPQEGRES